ncbi:hypothetical protein HNR42_003570 [Deinobacterium chartae]|uniref:Carbon monoxide dehydrogenase subunit G n=1 Tax=Deinobacterium chartae TaxID=521158 RepID=A0A841I8J6_9DEIO|nr:hypothetical protein [Deinobacterium chartae]
MQFRAEQRFRVRHPGPSGSALAFLRDPSRSLRDVRFIRDLRFEGGVVRAHLTVDVPMLGEQRLPFESRLEETARGARLVALPLSESAWAEVSGEGNLEAGELDYALDVTVHFPLPEPQKWGAAAFQKMVDATARRALARVTAEFPRGVAASIARET